MKSTKTYNGRTWRRFTKWAEVKQAARDDTPVLSGSDPFPKVGAIHEVIESGNTRQIIITWNDGMQTIPIDHWESYYFQCDDA